MRKIILILAVLMVTCPAWADVDIFCVPSADPMIIGPVPVDIRYISTEENNVRAFAFNITVDSGAAIVGADPESVDPNYNIHPGSFGLDPEGNPTGSVVADPMYPDTLPGGPEGITSEQASLYIGEVNAPAKEGLLFTIFVSSLQDCNVIIAPNVTRAGDNGVVMENPDEVVTVNYSECHLTARCWCGGDVTQAFNFVPMSPGDGRVDIWDIIVLTQPLIPTDPLYTVGPPVPAGYECADVQTMFNFGLPAVGADDILDIYDIIAIANWLAPTDPDYNQPCIVLGVAEAPPLPE